MLYEVITDMRQRMDLIEDGRKGSPVASMNTQQRLLDRLTEIRGDVGRVESESVSYNFV